MGGEKARVSAFGENLLSPPGVEGDNQETRGGKRRCLRRHGHGSLREERREWHQKGSVRRFLLRLGRGPSKRRGEVVPPFEMEAEVWPPCVKRGAWRLDGRSEMDVGERTYYAERWRPCFIGSRWPLLQERELARWRAMFENEWLKCYVT